MSEKTTEFSSWAIVELLGHVRMAGMVSEEERFGCKMGRIDIPTDDGKFATQYFGGGSVYRLTPTSEEAARAVAKRNVPQPVHQWELPAPPSGPVAPSEFSQSRARQDIERDESEDDLIF
ncbi:MAG: hypothetical protein A2428_03250 [Bdellovibrionales bacterium RIFOXYC1_FULL_54_43]|nr:MAG: hypothetical protein A2428_03250 [Bdellovibrionales bacterium RIFOXYC1_FULL_54_43]OFZ82697.1 MAG: hypothetical protein A2603_02685 [Bdellovibrionales bacterium RIFOXYD1_FULL_55_31]